MTLLKPQPSIVLKYYFLKYDKRRNVYGIPYVLKFVILILSPLGMHILVLNFGES